MSENKIEINNEEISTKVTKFEEYLDYLGIPSKNIIASLAENKRDGD